MGKIIQLDEELINHIAAGEVVERPASVLKELLDNAIDAGADKITIRVKGGGATLIEVMDNGSGIDKDDLALAVSPHSTSKISRIEDLSEIQSLGFRGEALASIAAVSDMKIVSKSGGDAAAYGIEVQGGKVGKIEKTSRETGTTVTVKNLFKNVPARRKFLKTPQTEYRKLMEIFYPVALINPQIHLVFESEGRTVHTLPSIKDADAGTLHPQRVAEILPDLDLVELFFDGEGVVIGGHIAKPTHKSPRAPHRYVFVNGRPIWDGGISKSVQIGTGRFLPEGVRVPFFVSISMPYEQVDVNVHPRKSEVRFANPYRVYSAVESAVKKSYENNLSALKEESVVDRFRDSRGYGSDSVGGLSKSLPDRGSAGADREFTGSSPSKAFAKPDKYDVARSIEFSKQILEDARENSVERGEGQGDSRFDFDLEMPLRARQYLGRYIVAEIEDAILIVDQHAAAERIRFEALLDDYASDGIEGQTLMLPVEVKMAQTEAMFVEEYKKVFEGLGYEVSIKKDVVKVSSVPTVLANGNHEELFRAVLADLQEIEDFAGQDSKLKEKYRDSLIATMACHTSVRMNQRLSDAEAAGLVKDLFKCRNKYTCPHGRPIVWRLGPEEIDRRFDR